jgi:hypothetical protein
MNQLFKDLLSKELDSLDRKIKNVYTKLSLALSPKGLIRSSVHIKLAFEHEKSNIIDFIRFATTQFETLISKEKGETSELENIYFSYIEDAIKNSLERMDKVIALAGASENEPIVKSIKSELGVLKEEVKRDIRIAKEKKKFGLIEKPITAINIQDSAISVLNVGEIQGNIENNIASLRKTGLKDIAEGIDKLSQEIIHFKNELGDKYTEALGLLEFLSEEANKPKGNRKVAVIKSSFTTINAIFSTVSKLSELWTTYGPIISGFLTS